MISAAFPYQKQRRRVLGREILLWRLGGALGLVTSLANADKFLPIARLDSIRGLDGLVGIA